MNKDATIKESLLVVGIGAISTGIERTEANLTLGLVLVGIGIAILAVRGYMKL